MIHINPNHGCSGPRLLALTLLFILCWILVLSLHERPATIPANQAGPVGTPGESSNPFSFLSTWNTNITYGGSTESNQVKLPLIPTGAYNFLVSWGDGSTNTITKWNQNQTLHTYASPGIYAINITGTIDGWLLDNSGDYLKLVGISQWGSLTFGPRGSYFAGCSNLVLNATDAPGLSGTTTLADCFFGCTNLGGIGNMSSWDVSGITNMESMFKNASSFNQSIGAWDVSHVTDMIAMFEDASSFNQPIGAWNVSRVNEMAQMFYYASSFNQPIGTWAVSHVVDMSTMFWGATRFNQNIDAWNLTSLTTTASMFAGAISFDKPLGGWNVSAVTYMGGMFQDATSFDQPIGGWNVSRVTDMSSMFSDATAFDQNISVWNVSAVANMYAMFFEAAAFNQPLDGWNVSGSTDMNGMFSYATSFDQPIGSWNVSRVNYMDYLFQNASSFDQPLESWNVTRVADMSYMFDGATSFDQSIGGWNVSRVTDMSYMFWDASSFDQPIGGWNVSHVTLMLCMFGGASTFDQSIDGWDVSHVTDVVCMFYEASSFDQPLDEWNVSSTEYTDRMFYGAVSFDQPLAGWNVSGVVSMMYMFYGASSFDQSLGAWNVSQVTSMVEMLYDAPISIKNYDALLIGWSSLSLQHGVIFDAGSCVYDASAAAARAAIISTFSWTISDGGLVTVPSAPLVVTAMSGNSSVVLKWYQPSDDGGFPILNYSIFAGPSPSAMTLLATTGNVSSYNASGLTNGRVYWFTVAAENAIGRGANATATSATPISVPSAPGSISATAGNGLVVLTWKIPASDGGSAITNYYIYAGTSPGTETLLATVRNVLTDTITGLTNGQAYYFEVSAVNGVGEGAKSSEISATPTSGSTGGGGGGSGGGVTPSYPVGLVFVMLVASCACLAAVSRRKMKS